MYISKRSGMDHSFTCKYTMPAFPSYAFTRWRHLWGKRHPIAACYLSIDPEGMKGWVGLVGWPIADGLPTKVVTRQIQVERKTGKVRRERPTFYHCATPPHTHKHTHNGPDCSTWITKVVGKYRERNATRLVPYVEICRQSVGVCQTSAANAAMTTPSTSGPPRDGGILVMWWWLFFTL